MSVDNRIVKLQFDNKQFEQGVSQSMSTLDKLEEKLQFKKSAKGFQTLQNAADSVGFDKLVAAIESINGKLSATGILAAKFVSNIADSIASGVKKIEQASIGQIKSGGWARAMKIENAKFAVQGLKGDWDELYKAIDYSVSGTAYGVDAAAKAASTLMASGVDYMKVVDTKNGQQLTQMHKSLRAISGVAAQTNSEFDDIAHIFTTVAGNGRLMADQLNQLSGRGMNAAAILGEQLGMSEAAIREATSKGQIDFQTFADAMDKAFGDHAKDANKTFTGSLSNMKAALSRFGAVFATPIIQKTNTFFIALTGKINEMKKAIADVTENGKILEERLESHFAKMWENLITLGSTLINSIDLTWFEKLADSADSFVKRLSDAFEIMNAFASSFSTDTNKTAKKVYDTTSITEGELDVVEKIIKGQFGNGAKRKKELEQYLKANEMDYDPDKLQAYVNVLSKVGYILEKSGIKKVKEAGKESEDYAKKQRDIIRIFSNIYLSIHNFNAALSKLKDNFSQYLGAILKPFGGLSGIVIKLTDLMNSLVLSFTDLVNALKPTEGVLAGFYLVGEALNNAFTLLVDGIKEAVRWCTKFVKDVLDSWKESGVLDATLVNISITITNLTRLIKNLATSAFRIFKAIATAFFKVFNPAKASGLLARFTGGLADISDQFLISEEATETLTDVLTGLFTVLDGVITKISETVIKITEFIGGLGKTDEVVESVAGDTEAVGEEAEETGSKLDKLTEIITKVKDFFKKFGEGAKELFEELKNNEGIKHLKDSLSDLGDEFKKGVTDNINDLKDGLGEINDEAGTKLTIKDVADGIGKFADKVAGVADELPDIIKKIEDFFDKAWTKIKGFFDKLKTNEDVMNFKDFFSKIFDFGKSFVTDTEKTFNNIGESIIKGLDGVNWKDVLSGSFILGALAFIVKLSGLAEAITNVFTGVDGIIKAVGTIAKNAAKFIGQIGNSLENISKALMITSIAFTILAIAGALYLISQIDENRIYDAASIIIVVLGAVYLITKALMKLQLGHQKILSMQTKKAEATQKSIGQIVAKFAGIAFVLFAAAKAIEWVIGAIDKMAAVLDKYEGNSDALMGSFITIGGILVGLFIVSGILVLISSKLVKKLDEGSDEALAVGILVAAFAVVFIGIGAALLLVSTAAEAVANMGDRGEDAIAGVTKVMLVLFAGMVAMMVFSRNLSPAQLVTVGVLLLEVIVAMMIIFGGIYFLALSLSGSEALGKLTGVGEKITQAVLLVCAVLAAMAVAIMLIEIGISSIAKYSKNKSNVAPVGKIMLGMILLIGVIIAAVMVLAFEMAKMNETQVQGLWLALGLISVMMLVIGELFDKIGNLIKTIGTGGDFSKYSGIFISLGAMMLLMFAGIAAVLMATGEYEFDTSSLALVIGGMIAIVGMIYLLIKQMGSSITLTDAAVMESAGKAFIMIGASILIIGIALALMADAMGSMNSAGITAAIIALVVIFAGIAAIVYALVGGKYAKSVDEDFITLIKSLGLMFIEIGAMILMVAAACQLVKDVSLGDMMSLILIVGLIGALMFGLSALFGMDNGVGKAARTGMEAIAIALIAIGAAFLIFGAALNLSALGLAALTAVLPEFGAAFSAVCEELSKHQGVIIGLGVLVVIILAIVAYTVLKTIPIIDKIVTAIVAAVTTIAEVIKNLGKKTADGISNFHKNKKLSAGVKATIVTLITALASSLVESGPEVLQKIGDFLWMIIDWLISIIPKLCDKLIELLLELIWGVLDALTGRINEIEAVIKGIAVTIGAIFVKALLDLFADAIDLLGGWFPGVSSLVKKIKSFGDEVVATSRNTTQKLKEDAKKRDEAIRNGDFLSADEIASLYDYSSLDYAAKNSENFVVASGEITENMQKAYKKFASAKELDLTKTFLYGNNVTSMFADKNINEIKALMETGKYYTDANYQMFEIIQGTSDEFKKVKNDAKAQKNFEHYYSEWVTGTAETALDALKDKGSDLKDKATGALTDVLPNTDDLNKAFNIDAAQNAMDFGGDFIGPQLPDSKITGSDVIDTNNITQTASDTGQEAGKLVMYNTGQAARKEAGETGSAAADAFSDPYANELVANSDQYDEAGKTVAQTTADGVGSKESQDKMREAAEILSYVGADQLQNYGLYKWISAGGNIVSALRYHLDKFADGPVTDPNSARALMDRIYHAMNDQFVGPTCWDSHSPSRRMLTVGEQLMQGLTNGIYDEQTGAIKSMTDVYNSMVSVFSNPLDYVSKIASGEYQYDPSIRPVLDTSLVARGAYGINSMFDNQNVTLNGLSGSIAADIGRLDNSNADIIAELRLLRGDMTVMGEQISNMQVVMDTGRLVGAISNEMDGALGSRSSYISRGKGN